MKCLATTIPLGIAIISLLVSMIVMDVRNNTLETENTRLNKELVKAARRDSLYWVHISTCRFISSDQIKVGYDNYIQLIDSSKPEN